MGERVRELLCPELPGLELSSSSSLESCEARREGEGEGEWFQRGCTVGWTTGDLYIQLPQTKTTPTVMCPIGMQYSR